MNVRLVDKVSNISKREFHEKYLSANRPVILKDLAKDWKATNKWTFDFFRKTYGHWEIPMYDKSYHNPGNGYMKPVTYKKFSDYLDIIENEPCKLRFHNFQIMKRAPELSQDYSTPEIMDGFFKFALMFFGGKGSALNLHYDIDCSNVFLTHFQTIKEVYLFPPEEAKYLYQLPFTNHAHVDVLKPDWEEFPAFKYTHCYKAEIHHGETLFIPRLWWHYVYYSEGGFSLALRANESLSSRARGLWNIVRLFTVDTGMNFLAGHRWKDYKDNKARANAVLAMQKIKSV
ncbi:cupin-like domain-containing protein [Robertkochia solimangrovi]|uniref:cupin-like domain-containing protein n=1 Tax=Robertkochia solimangrovi TaxID=2213046 RepID=UPI00117D239D|nr:cupin-like domain-containing protein [Robertkochia solimangrovi]TRZ45359.1 cupin-like domain-containing protein [Robertkochia solimangrovi]